MDEPGDHRGRPAPPTPDRRRLGWWPRPQSPTRVRLLAGLTAAVALVAALLVVLPGSGGDPLGGRRLYLDPSSPALAQVRSWDRSGRTADARRLDLLADQPVGFWLTDASAATVASAGSLVRAANKVHELPLLVLYDLPDRSCGAFTGNVGTASAGYIRWVGEVRRALGSQPAIVVVEPDAVAQLASGCVPRSLVAPRERDLRVATATLRRDPRAVVYLDAGNSAWVHDVALLARYMRASGALEANGFALNVANFQTVEASVAYGDHLSSDLGGRHFVIDTGRDGSGPLTSATTPDETWCNPPGRSIGPRPTTRTGYPRVDAFLWVKQPGQSDGSCGGGPPAGDWWPAYALALVRHA